MAADQKINLSTELAELKMRQAALKHQIKKGREQKRRDREQRQAELGLPPVPRPRKNNRFATSVAGDKEKITTYLSLVTLREVRELAGDSGMSVSGALESLLRLGLEKLDNLQAGKPSISAITAPTPVEEGDVNANAIHTRDGFTVTVPPAPKPSVPIPAKGRPQRYRY